MRPFFSNKLKISTFCNDFKSGLVRLNQIESYFIFMNQNIKYIQPVTVSLVYKDVFNMEANTFFEIRYFWKNLDVLMEFLMVCDCMPYYMIHTSMISTF